MADKNDEINRYIHEQIEKRGCLAIESPDWAEFDEEGICAKCGIAIEAHERLLDYTQSLDLIAPVEAKVIEMVGWSLYYPALSLATEANLKVPNLALYALVAATAQQRATACKAAWKEHTEVT